MAEVVLDGVTKIYDDGTRAVSELDLHVADKEFLVLVGPSGCGKTTALRMVAGLEDITAGTIRIGDTIVNRLPAKDRDIAMVFQSYALYPHLSVRDNIGFGLKLRRTPKAEIRRRVEDAARILGLEDHLDRKPRNLSGGQRQRVAMGRAIVREPQAFLMDEPLSNLDAKLRVQMRAEIARIQRDLGVTTLYVTHDQVEAMTLGDRVAVMKRGVLQQVAPPQELYDQPVNVFVAGFIGSPAMNLFESKLAEDGGAIRMEIGSQRLTIPTSILAARPALRGHVGRTVISGIRPEDMEDATIAPQPDGASLRSEVDLVEAMGSDVVVHFEVDAPPVITEDTRELAADVAHDALSGLEESARRRRSVVVARFNPRTRVREGDSVQVSIDMDRLYFFDPDTGSAISEG